MCKLELCTKVIHPKYYNHLKNSGKSFGKILNGLVSGRLAFKSSETKEPKLYSYRISANSFHGNNSFLNLSLCTVTLDHSTQRRGNYSRAETIRGNTVFEFYS